MARPARIARSLIVFPASLRSYGTGFAARCSDTTSRPVHPPAPFAGEHVAMSQPSGAAFDVVLLAHAACAVAGLVTSATATATAGRLERQLVRTAPLPDALRRYFRPGLNWAGRTLYGIPAFGFALLAMSRGAYALGDGWVLAGLTLFVGVVLLAEGVLWPAEQRLQEAVAAGVGGEFADAGAVRRDARSMARAGGAVLVLLVVGTVLMVAQP